MLPDIQDAFHKYFCNLKKNEMCLYKQIDPNQNYQDRLNEWVALVFPGQGHLKFILSKFMIGSTRLSP